MTSPRRVRPIVAEMSPPSVSAGPSIEMVPIQKLIPDPKNARTHSRTQLEQIASSMAEFGWTNPVLVDAKYNIIAGHGRSQAAQLRRQGKKWVPMNAGQLKALHVPVIVLKDLTEAQVKALRIADNKLGDNSGWDQVLLREALADLDGMEFDMDILGFSDAEMSRMLQEAESMEVAAEVAEPKLSGVRFRVLIECESEQGQAETIGFLEEQGYKCQPLMS